MPNTNNDEINTMANDIHQEFDNNECSICLGPHVNKSRPACGHVFCYQCLVDWCQTKLQCPTCRKPFRSFIHSIQPSTDEHQVHVLNDVPLTEDEELEMLSDRMIEQLQNLFYRDPFAFRDSFLRSDVTYTTESPRLEFGDELSTTLRRIGVLLSEDSEGLSEMTAALTQMISTPPSGGVLEVPLLSTSSEDDESDDILLDLDACRLMISLLSHMSIVE